MLRAGVDKTAQLHRNIELKYAVSFQELEESHVGYSGLIRVGGDVVSEDDNLAEGIPDFLQRAELLLFLLIGIEGIGRLNIELVNPVGRDKIDFILLEGRFAPGHFSRFDDANIHEIIPTTQFIVNHILHDMSDFLLAEIEPGIPQTHIYAVVFRKGFVVPLAFDVISSRSLKQIGILQTFNVTPYRGDIYLYVLYT